ncbi:protein of unknown function [Selenomonas sp. GACV-9]|uniref:DUF1848 domain-containing protein n=1 Tax=Selenomonas sp. GACV-9 TaxID=3158782 RepID=UPI0008F3B173|nr:protein of unknown function [Selenomonas ruminantium]
MIISVSRRTDIPALYWDWFCGRLKAGYVDVVNPFNRKQVSCISLQPERVDCLVFWTKDPTPMLDKLALLGHYPYYVQVSLTPYDTDIEENLRPKEEIIKAMQALSLQLGRERVVWRYDPILLNAVYTKEKHFAWFTQVLAQLAPYVERCVISFIDLYAKTKKNTQGLNLHELSEAEMREIAAGLAGLAKGSGVVLQTCSEAIDLAAYGIGHGACLDGALIERITGKPLKKTKAKSQRPLCNCVESFDIGQYDTCIHGCHYCYANASPQRAQQGFAAHVDSSSLLTGKLLGDERITEHGREKRK